MNQSRLDQLFNLQKEDPDDPFILYAIALEYKKSDLNQAASYFNQVITRHPEYLAAYYHAAENYLKLENYSSAKKTLEEGMEVAKNSKTFTLYKS